MTAPTFLKPPRAATPMAFVQAIMKGYARYGVDPGGALRAAQITPRELWRPGARVTAAQFEALNAHAMQELDDEALGWFSRRLPWGSYGLLCRASLGAPTLGVALKRWCRHHALLVDDIGLSLHVADGLAHVRIEERRDLGMFREFCLVSSLRFLHGYASWAIDSRVSLREARFPFAPPPHADAYPLMFPGHMVFDAAQAGYSFDAQYLALPLLRDEAALRQMLRRALPLTVLQYRRDRLLSQRVRELLRTHGAELTKAEALAGMLHMSSRTLHRQLLAEGLSLQSLKNEVRLEQALDQLRRSTRSVKQIALAVGFRNEKSFSRAFSQWTGMAPGAWRQREGVAPLPAPSPASSPAP
ncbi:AraC family transcriptional regulator [Xenophilus sp. Marseille-Q4582]|uniref:AraC family transcriptional regulator n=1 Tax=Xenophilus sp. Marseille-Q4582 TaxID=2866600 RepID=UPI001CE45995|nr:AraC family transcriptional regulator [Xenophilus sp. Marseille-Q4582]